MPNEITIDDVVGGKKSREITIDDALATHEAKTAEYQVSQADRRYQFASELQKRHPEQFPGEPQVDPYAFQRGPRVQAPGSSNFGASVKAGLVEDPGTKRRLIAESLFPGDPKGVERVGFMEGEPVYVDSDGTLRRLSGSAASFGANVISNAPEIAGSVVGSFATGNPVTGAALGGAGGRGAKRGLAQLVFGEPATPGSVAGEMTTEGALGLAAGGVGKGVARFADRGRIVDFTPQNIKSAEQAREYIKQSTGIDVDLAQASGNRKLIAIRNYAARYPGKSAEVIQAVDEAAQGQLDTAVNRLLNAVAKATPVEIAGANGVNAARLAIKAAREKAYADVGPLYEAAYAAKREVTNPRLLTMLKLPYFKQSFAAGQRIAKLEGKALKEGQKPDLRSLDYTKRALDDQIEMLTEAGRRQEAAALIERKNDFLTFLDNVSGDKYKLARNRYAELARGSIEPLEQGAVGVIAKIQNPKTATAAARIFSDRNITPAEIRATRVALLQQNPEAWNGLVRQWIGMNWNRALKQSQTGDVGNPAGKLRQALIGDPTQKAKMEAALGPGGLQAFDDLMNAAESLSRTPIRGSDTSFNEEINRQLRGRGALVLRWLTAPRSSAIQAAEQRALDQSVEAITEALLNPAKRGQLRQVVRMPLSTRKAIILSTILSGQAAKLAAASEVDAPPEAVTRGP